MNAKSFVRAIPPRAPGQPTHPSPSANVRRERPRPQHYYDVAGPVTVKQQNAPSTAHGDVDRRRRPPRVASRGRRKPELHVLQTRRPRRVDGRRELASWRQGRRPPQAHRPKEWRRERNDNIASEPISFRRVMLFTCSAVSHERNNSSVVAAFRCCRSIAASCCSRATCSRNLLSSSRDFPVLLWLNQLVEFTWSN